MVRDNKVYSQLWDPILIPASKTQENAAQRKAFHLIGSPFDWRGMVSFLFPFFERRRKATYCSAVILDVLQSTLHMFPGVNLKISPNGLYRLFLSQHPTVIAGPLPASSAGVTMN